MDNATIAKGVLYRFSAQRGIVRTPLGIEEVEFADSVRDVVKDWGPEDVTVTLSASGEFVIYSHGREAIAYNLEAGRWSAPFSPFKETDAERL